MAGFYSQSLYKPDRLVDPRHCAGGIFRDFVLSLLLSGDCNHWSFEVHGFKCHLRCLGNPVYGADLAAQAY